MASAPAHAPRLIVTRTPLRVSFAGGGTDLSAFYDVEPGAVVSTAITQYVYVTVKRHSELYLNRPDGPGGTAGAVRVCYSKSEEVATIDEIENNIARECLRFLEIEPPIYVSTVGDVPASTGLGGSSAFAVGLLNALHALRGERVTPGQLAEEACHVEIDRLGEPIGKQDQYAAAFGGMNVFCFFADGGVTTQHVNLGSTGGAFLFDNILMFWTGHQRAASEVLTKQRSNTPTELDRLRRMRDQVWDIKTLFQDGSIDLYSLGKVLDEGWRLKRGLAEGVSNSEIDRVYERALDAGALGGKLCGAGGGGLLLFIVPPDRQEAVRAAVAPLAELDVSYEVHGSQVVAPFTH
jgi:D-glycero-alpha-D-manno-heptose-7-phosphate kinase